MAINVGGSDSKYGAPSSRTRSASGGKPLTQEELYMGSSRGKTAQKPKPAAKRNDAFAASLGFKPKGAPESLRPKTSTTETTEDPYAWLRDMLGGGGGGGGGSYSRRTYSDEQVAGTQARLQAIYDRYAQDIADRETAIGEMYTGAGTNLGSIYDTAVGTVNAAYDAARAAQTQQLLNLGMTEQTPVQSFGNQTGATTSLQNLRAAVLAQNEASKKAAITNQRLASEAARREGTEQVARAVSEMQNAMTTVSGGGGGGGGGGLNPYQYASLVLKQQAQDAANQQAAAKMAGANAPQVDPTALLAQIKKANPDLSNAEAIQVARLY